LRETFHENLDLNVAPLISRVGDGSPNRNGGDELHVVVGARDGLPDIAQDDIDGHQSHHHEKTDATYIVNVFAYRTDDAVNAVKYLHGQIPYCLSRRRSETVTS
jgi:hypothetical protein